MRDLCQRAINQRFIIQWTFYRQKSNFIEFSYEKKNMRVWNEIKFSNFRFFGKSMNRSNIFFSGNRLLFYSKWIIIWKFAFITFYVTLVGKIKGYKIGSYETICISDSVIFALDYNGLWATKKNLCRKIRDWMCMAAG